CGTPLGAVLEGGGAGDGKASRSCGACGVDEGTAGAGGGTALVMDGPGDDPCSSCLDCAEAGKPGAGPCLNGGGGGGGGDRSAASTSAILSLGNPSSRNSLKSARMVSSHDLFWETVFPLRFI